MTPAGRQIWHNQDNIPSRKNNWQGFRYFFLDIGGPPNNIAAWENTFGFVLFPAIGAVVWTAPFH